MSNSTLLSPNITSGMLDTILSTIPDQLETDEAGALIATILDRFDFTPDDTLKIAINGLKSHLKQREDDERPSEDERVDAAMKLLPPLADGFSVMAILCMVMGAYKMPGDLAEKVAVMAGRTYRESNFVDGMGAKAVALGIDTSIVSQPEGLQQIIDLVNAQPEGSA